ncbi:gnk2-like domain-containing protein [Artemisia annua]|uniref:Gnk2-like domain-containing protein n=1 Tax=Artemisia annua TaxID=35608 RepID=A0A2U1PAL4_ARTAN|nr:gnk2-like domain-containing protein [Artemisia annua]
MDRVYSVALCRGDINQDVCLSCLRDIIVEIRLKCPNNIYVSAIYEYFLLTYINDTLLGNTKMDARGYVNVEPNSTNIVSFHEALRLLLDKLRADASNGGPLMKLFYNESSALVIPPPSSSSPSPQDEFFLGRWLGTAGNCPGVVP